MVWDKKAGLILLTITLATLIVGCSGPNVLTVTGVGATFPAPIYTKWAHQYEQLNGVRINYQPQGSGAGIKQIKDKTVDFGASDAPLLEKELDEHGLIQFPVVIGGVVPVVNLKGIAAGQLKLNGNLLADIFLGKITKWNDPAILKENPGIKLPDSDIKVVHRSDGSGTTWIFTNYLSLISNEWKTKVGTDKSVNWPVGQGGKGNEGVSAFVQQLDGSIGYVEYAYALQNKMTHVQLQNKDGKYVEPSIESFQAAASNADWANAPGFYVVLTNQPGEKSWPITGASYVIIYKDQKDEKIGKAILDFFKWGYEHGGDMAKELNYVPMPENVIKMVEAKWKETVKFKGNPLL